MNKKEMLAFHMGILTALLCFLIWVLHNKYLLGRSCIPIGF